MKSNVETAIFEPFIYQNKSIIMPTKLIFILLLGFFSVQAVAQTEKKSYDKALADSLGADDYGMKMYILVMLKTGSGKVENKTTRDSLFRGHLKNIGHLAEIGKLVVAGPMGKNEKNYEGIFILNVKTLDDAKLLLDTDPAIKAQLLEPELFEWYGSAALPLYLKFHDKVQKKDF